MADSFDIAIVGAGPAGLAAAAAAVGQGRRVALIDSQPKAGGQVWRHDASHGYPAIAEHQIHKALSSRSVTWLPDTQVIGVDNGRLLLQDPRRGYLLAYRSLVIAQGARELLLPHPGWTLPGVVGAGGLQALAKQGWSLKSKRVVVAGSGPLLLAAAHTARRHGAIVLGIHEQAAPGEVLRFAAGLWRWPAKLVQAAVLKAGLAGVPYCRGSVVTAAHGTDRVTAVDIEGPLGHERVDCDVLAVGYGLVPDTSLARQLGCAMRANALHAQVEVDGQQQTTQPRIFAAGETCGIGGRDCARLEGHIAGLAAAGAAVPFPLMRQRDRARAFASHLQQHFELSPQVRHLADDDTLICRCEDIPLRAIRRHADARSVKLATRCGMGACQGRICGAALTQLGHGARDNSRPPLFPARLSTLGEPDFPSALLASRGTHT
jgi:NADPH-dependent 2,4-dienoyl-CoA reductase/sulfur reductase-like enzyme